MSILIKGMKMPKNCDSCRFMVFEDTNCISVPELFCGCPIVFRAHPQHEDHRPDYCPLTELPPHGRLIDADALPLSLVTINDLPTRGGLAVYRTRDVTAAPTIIEAEENKDGT